MLQTDRYQTKTDRGARIGQLPLPAGSTVWLIRHSSGLVFGYCYVSQQDAARVLEEIATTWDDKALRADFKHDPEHSLHVGPLTWPATKSATKSPRQSINFRCTNGCRTIANRASKVM